MLGACTARTHAHMVQHNVMPCGASLCLYGQPRSAVLHVGGGMASWSGTQGRDGAECAREGERPREQPASATSSTAHSMAPVHAWCTHAGYAFVRPRHAAEFWEALDGA